MKVKVISPDNRETGTIELPEQFEEEIRPDLIKRAYLTSLSNSRQPYGSDPMAGKKTSVRVSKRRRDYRTSYGKGISRVPRKVITRRGMQFMWIGAFAPSTVKGRRAHPPKVEKIWEKKINKKERRKSIRSALAAALTPSLVSIRHHIPSEYPFVLDDSFEKISRTKEVLEALEGLGMREEIERVSERKIRAGRGKMRGRRYRKKTGPLIVVSRSCQLMKSARNLPGFDIIKVRDINVRHLAPGAEPGRLTFFTRSAVETMAEEKLFMG